MNGLVRYAFAPILSVRMANFLNGEITLNKRRDLFQARTSKTSSPDGSAEYAATEHLESHRVTVTTPRRLETVAESPPQNQNPVTTLGPERSSAYGIADQLLQGLDPEHHAVTESDAIPDAVSNRLPLTSTHRKTVCVSELLGCDLPPREVCATLFDVYIKSVQWFTNVFHEPSLRSQLEAVLYTGRMAQEQLSTGILILVILLYGARYITREELVRSSCPDLDLNLLRNNLLERIEAKFLALLDRDDIGALQVCVLLNCYYFYHGRPQRCLAINSTATRIAQTLKLDRESSWPVLDATTREVRRRVWWALYVLNGHAALTYGTPIMTPISSFRVGLPQGANDVSGRCPGFDSQERFEDGALLPVTTLSYQRFKFRLYRIAEPIMSEIYFLERQSAQALAAKVNNVHQKLLQWERSLPAELKLQTFVDQQDTLARDSLTQVFQNQALALQLSYDNIQLILHRRLLIEYKILAPRNHSGKRTSITAEINDNFWATSKEQCWKSARRTSLIDQYPHILRQVRNSPAAGYAGLHAFSAGVMLGIFALSEPLSARAHEAKYGIGRVIRMPGLIGYRTAISDQTGQVLEKLLRLIMESELKLLTSQHVTLGAPENFPPDGETNDGTLTDTSLPAVLPQGRETAGKCTSSHSAKSSAMDFVHRDAEHESRTAPYDSMEENPTDLDQTWQESDADNLNGSVLNHQMSSSFFDSDFLNELIQLDQGWMWEQGGPLTTTYM